MEDIKLLTVKEAAEATRLSKSKIYELIYRGVLHPVRLPGCTKVLIAEAELQEYIRRGVAAGTVERTAASAMAI